MNSSKFIYTGFLSPMYALWSLINVINEQKLSTKTCNLLMSAILDTLIFAPNTIRIASELNFMMKSALILLDFIWISFYDMYMERIRSFMKLTNHERPLLCRLEHKRRRYVKFVSKQNFQKLIYSLTNTSSVVDPSPLFRLLNQSLNNVKTIKLSLC